MAPQNLRLAVAQAHTLKTTEQTLSALGQITRAAADQGVDLILFPEAYIGGYPRTATFGSAIGARQAEGKEQFLQYFNAAVDLGDIPEGGGERWIRRELEMPREGPRGDGTRERLEEIAKETGVFIVAGLIERCAGTLYCGVVYVCPRYGIIGKRRKVMPTGSERLVWGQGQASSLRAVTTTIKGVKITLAAAICWENYMPLLRQSLYSQNVNLYLAPTADARDTWLPLMRTIASEGRCVVLSANQCMAESKLPDWLTGKKTDPNDDICEPLTINGRPSEVTINANESSNGHHALTEDPNSASGSEQNRSIEIPDMSSRRSNSLKKIPSRTRRKSTVTDDGHHIVLPGIADEAETMDVEEENDEIPPEQTIPPARLRRGSTMTEDGHEIALPRPNGSTKQNTNTIVSKVPTDLFKRRISIATENGHDIALPKSKDDNYNSASPSGETKLICRGGSSIVSSTAEVVAGPLWDDQNGLLVSDVDFEDCIRGRLDLDVGGSYSRSDAFKLSVEGLDLSPPP